MLRLSSFLACLALASCVANAAPKDAIQPKDLRVRGSPPLGAFGIDTLEHVEDAARMGMNLVFSYDPEAARKQLEPNDPTGRAVASHGMMVVYPLCGRFTRARLADDVDPDDTVIPVVSDDPASIDSFPESGYLMIEGERVEYRSRNRVAFLDCARGAEGTLAASHAAGILLCDSESLREEILAVKDSPNLWGYWLVDDRRPLELDSLREMSRIIRATDRDSRGRPNPHAIVIGIGDASAMANFEPGIGDAIGVYLYPYRRGVLDRHARDQLRFIAGVARSAQPGIGLIGIYQAFACPESEEWNAMPTPEQVREDMLAYLEHGADGLMAFIYHWQGERGEQRGMAGFPDVRNMVGRTNREIISGAIARTAPTPIRVDTFSVRIGPAAALSPGGMPGCDLDDPTTLAALVLRNPGRLFAEPFIAAGRSYPLKAVLPAWNPYVPGSDRWPIAQFPEDFLVTTDWSRFRYLEQPVYNPGERAITVRVSLEDAAKGWWERSEVVIPPRTPAVLRVPMDEARLAIDPSRISRWLLWVADPSRETNFRLGTPLLVP